MISLSDAPARQEHAAAPPGPACTWPACRAQRGSERPRWWRPARIYGAPSVAGRTAERALITTFHK